MTKVDDIQVNFDKGNIDDIGRPSNVPLSGSEHTPTAQSHVFEKHWFLSGNCHSIRQFLYSIGTFLCALGTALDILYVQKAPFYNQTVFITMVLMIVIRIVVVIGIGLYYYQSFVWNYRPRLARTDAGVKEDKDGDGEAEYDEKGQSGNDADVQAAKEQGQYMYLGLLSYYYTGGYRLLPPKDFRGEIIIGYAVEAITLIIPMILCEVSNNAGTDTGVDITALQSAAILVKIFAFLVLIFEGILMGCEMRYIYNLRKNEEEGFEKITEEQRRSQNHHFVSRLGLCLITFVVVVLLIGTFAAPNRECGAQLVLENAVCVKCADKNCLDCSGGSNTCKSCATGFLSVGGKCRDCNVDSKTEMKCESCTMIQGAIQCLSCADGYRLDSDTAQCRECESHCKSCTKSKCTACQEGYLF